MMRRMLKLLALPLLGRTWFERLRDRPDFHILIDPRTGRVATYDPKTDEIDLGGGMRAHMSEVERCLGKTQQDNQ